VTLSSCVTPSSLPPAKERDLYDAKKQKTSGSRPLLRGVRFAHIPGFKFQLL
jgi:hypothetical protein